VYLSSMTTSEPHMPELKQGQKQHDPSIQTRWSLIGRLQDWEDQRSWQEFFNTYWKLIYSVALKAGLTDVEAQEVVQETVISVARKMPEFTSDPAAGSFKSWLLTLTRWRIGDQLRKRRNAFSDDHSKVRGPGPPAKNTPEEPGPRTSTIERIADPKTGVLERLWNEEWEKNILEIAVEHVKSRVDPEEFQLFDFHVLKQWPARKVASKLGLPLARVYFAKYKITRLLKRSLKGLDNTQKATVGSQPTHEQRSANVRT